MTKLPLSSASDEPPPSADATGAEPPTAAIQAGVLAALGRPPGLYRVAVLPLWPNFYRVNVLIGADPTAVQIAHSYFVEAGADGRVRSATPPLARLYE
jgi:hypothetical protein